ncbi:hypothetical protein K402DRAFT_402830 [Aulographum hederae CBS 113979]|uniref:DH domain-containing protein n=1 Tax=Aulographum hederae CBS 113979 TaxID=1176131 RepID=A0A6G1H6N2_9PEZI|nr:hypothetical protein K402DRAFT_402830 [Aulographum hederae CBS 113979]
MAYVLALQPPVALKRSLSDIPHMRSCSPFSEHESIATIQHHVLRATSAASFVSATSFAGSWHGADGSHSQMLASRTILDLIDDLNATSSSRRSSSQALRKASWGTDIEPSPRPASATPSLLTSSPERWEARVSDGLLPCTPEIIVESEDMCSDDTRYESLADEFTEESTFAENSESNVSEPTSHLEADLEAPVVAPFRRWVSTLRRRNVHRNIAVRSPKSARKSLEEHKTGISAASARRLMVDSNHRKSLSETSTLGFITRVKSASITLASTSLGPLSRRGGRSGDATKEQRGSGYSDARASTESAAPSFGPLVDEKAWLRSVQRRKILEELIATEEGYIGDMKALINVYFTLLASVATLPVHIRISVQQTVGQILQLHEDLLGELHKVVPNAEITERSPPKSAKRQQPRHVRWHSADIMPGKQGGFKVGRKFRHSIDASVPTHQERQERHSGISTDTKTAADVARVFDRFLKRFLAYEAFAAHNDILGRDAASTSRMIPMWYSYERGIEALSSSLTSIDHREASSKKGLTLADLLIKPIQRVTRYPLLFEALCKQTPVIDDPVSHEELQKVRYRLNEVASQINQATDNPEIRRLIETTWLLQDRLIFDDQDVPTPVIHRLLGHVVLCGVLHVAYQTPEGVKGQYMICVLYKSCLVLAIANKSVSSYNVCAAIPLVNGGIEEPDDGRGLQCHTAPHTWKLIFEFGHKLYEVMFSACSAREEEEWKGRLRERISNENQDFSEGRSSTNDLFTSLLLDMKAIGNVLGQPGSFARRMSIQRAATLGPKSTLHQVIIKNTQAQKSVEHDIDQTAVSVARSQSHMSYGHIPTLAPRRAERIRLEASISDVWTRDSLPFPGMASRRPENPIRASANSVMRKLSMASIASNFSKRSTSYTSLSHSRYEENSTCQKPPMLRSVASAAHVPSRQPMKGDKRRVPILVDFHNAPEAFLPTDFELGPKPDSKGRRFMNRASSGDYPLKSAASRFNLKKGDSPYPLDKQIAPGLSPASLLDKDGNKVALPAEVQKVSVTGTSSGPIILDSSGKLEGDFNPMRRLTKSRSRMFRFFEKKLDGL